MPKEAFQHIEIWIFDLDNTLYPPSSALFEQIHEKMTQFICNELSIDRAEADRLRGAYWRRYGTTLNGLMQEHNLEPERFLDEVHDVDLSTLAPNPELAAVIDALPGRKIVHTNGSRGHAARVLAQLNLAEQFSAVYAIEDTLFEPKPARAAYDRVIGADRFAPERAAMIEDTEKNLVEPHALGMRTVLAHAEPDADSDHVHFTTDDLAAFLRRLVA